MGVLAEPPSAPFSDFKSVSTAVTALPESGATATCLAFEQRAKALGPAEDRNSALKAARSQGAFGGTGGW